MVAPFGDVIRSTNSPGSGPYGIGGDANTIWHCNSHTSDFLCELSTTDFSVVRSAASSSASPTGIGGDVGVIWHCDQTSNHFYELDPSDFSVVRSIACPDTLPSGAGGDSNYIWYCEEVDKIYELSTIDLSVIQTVASPGTKPAGIGGVSNKIWHVDDDTSYLYELSTTDLSVIRSTSIWRYNDIITGIGGDVNTIWSCAAYNNNIYERSTGVEPTYTISGNVKDSDGNNLNNVTITLENSTDYSTITNINGDYSQIVDSDIYTVTASLTQYLDSSASVDASAGNQTQNFTLLKPVISGNVSNSDGEDLEGVEILFTDDESYEAVTDLNGDYSQIVNTDVYDVVASLLGNDDQSASVNVTLSNQTQDFVFPITIASHDKAIRLKSRYLLED